MNTIHNYEFMDNANMPKFSDEQAFQLNTVFEPSPDQKTASTQILQGFTQQNLKHQMLLGVTGSGKTYTMALTIQGLKKPTLILAPNKTLAAQLYGEMKLFFPNNAVEYFVSYYDYYRPEAYIPQIDRFIEKKSLINDNIDRMRHSATKSLLDRGDVIVISSVSCIYGLGSADFYSELSLSFEKDQDLNLLKLMGELDSRQYRHDKFLTTRGSYRNLSPWILDIFPSHMQDRAWRITTKNIDDSTQRITYIHEIDPLDNTIIDPIEHKVTLYPKSHYLVPTLTLSQGIEKILAEMTAQVAYFEANNKFIEAQRIKERVMLDVNMLRETGVCRGIEHYSHYFTGQKEGEPPANLFEYFANDGLLIIDESHMSIPQLRGMYFGDKARKDKLVDYGFRLPSCRNNRPMTFAEFEAKNMQTLFVSATPGEYELVKTEGIVIDQVIRPTGLLDPICIIRPIENQIEDVTNECKQVVESGGRILITTLTKKMAEAVSDYLNDVDGIVAKYLHSDLNVIERNDAIKSLRLGTCQVLVGVNLLREGLDIPECALVAILDADKEGFLRSRSSLIQTIGRAARNSQGRAILYANTLTKSIIQALDETQRRRILQEKYNTEHNITPKTIFKDIIDIFDQVYEDKKKLLFDRVGIDYASWMNAVGHQRTKLILKLQNIMHKEAQEMNFDIATQLRDFINDYHSKQTSVG